MKREESTKASEINFCNTQNSDVTFPISQLLKITLTLDKFFEKLYV